MLAMPPELAEAERGEEATGREQVVLVVDDEPDILTSIKTFVEGAIENVTVETATSGPKALELLKEQPVDLILSDYRMPEMNGLEFLAEARKIHARVPRIIITAYPDLDLALEAINEERVERFFTKPLDPMQIVETVQSILQGQRTDAMRKQAYARALNMLRKRGRGDEAPDQAPPVDEDA